MVYGITALGHLLFMLVTASLFDTVLPLNSSISSLDNFKSPSKSFAVKKENAMVRSMPEN